MLNLACPYCGGELDLQNLLTVGKCLYCGRKVLLTGQQGLQDQQRLASLRELLKVALSAGNAFEALAYANNILEVDPNDVEAWIAKAKATAWTTSEYDDHFNEAMQYLATAESLGASPVRVAATRSELKQTQASWYNQLGLQYFRQAEATYSDYLEPESTGGGVHLLSSIQSARDATSSDYIRAMDFFAAGVSLVPADMTLLDNIDTTASKAHWISWSHQVIECRSTLRRLRERGRNQHELTQCRVKLKDASNQLARIEANGGFLANTRRKAMKLTIARLEQTIERLTAELAWCEALQNNSG
jgi:hypothetical protein